MKYVVIIMDGASGLPLPQHGNQTCLELAQTPNLDALAQSGMLGLARTVPVGYEPSSACACMSVIGYDPQIYYKGRGGIEARSMDIPIAADEAVFRCNLVALKDGRMWSYSSGHIITPEARELVLALEAKLGSDTVKFYPGVSYRHICKLKGQMGTLEAVCTPPHDIPDQPVAGYLPHGKGSQPLRELMARSESILCDHPVNQKRIARGEIPATSIWLFWGTGRIPDMPSLKEIYGLNAAMTSGVDLLRGLAKMASMDLLEIPGVTDNIDNDYKAQAIGTLAALKKYDLVITHIEAPDEAAHVGSVEGKVEAIHRIDAEVISRLRNWHGDDLRVLIMPDHPTPIKIQTHSPEPVPFLLWGSGFRSNGAKRFSEAEASRTGLFLEAGYNIMSKLVGS